MSDMTVQEIGDRLELVENLSRYHHAVDAKDWAALEGLFTDDAFAEYTTLNDTDVFGLEGRYDGSATIVDWVRSNQEAFEFNGAPTHFMTNHVIDLKEDGATSRSFFNAVDLVTGRIIGTGIYTCRHSRQNGGWRITQVQLAQRLCDDVIASIAAQRASVGSESPS